MSPVTRKRAFKIIGALAFQHLLVAYPQNYTVVGLIIEAGDQSIVSIGFL